MSNMSEKPNINTSYRLFDLVRYMRSELHKAELITDEEYGWLCFESEMATSPKKGSPSRQRLEDYDELRAQLTKANARVKELEEDKKKSDAMLLAYYAKDNKRTP